MQYILTEEEYLNLKNSNENYKKSVDDQIGELCKLVADHMPIEHPFTSKAHPRDVPDEPWGCYHNKKYEWYCDCCPVNKQCPLPKNWSK